MRDVANHSTIIFAIAMKTVTLIFAVLTAFGIANAQTCRVRGICYALDNSGSISAAEYEQIKNFTVTSSRNFAIPGVPTEYSAAWFNSGFGTIQAPTTDLEGDFVPTIQADTRRGGGTNIYRGLSACFDLLPSDGARVIIVITDGQGAFGVNPITQIRNDGIAVVSVGVGNGIDVAFLSSIATRPEFYVPATFDMLPSLATTVEEAACDAVAEIVTPEPTPPVIDDPTCRIRGICYALDNSGSILPSQYEQIKNFTVTSSRNFAVPGVTTEYSAAWFNSGFGTIQAPTTDLEGIFVPTIQADTLRSGGTNIYGGLSACFALLPSGGARAIVVVTDGQGASPPDPLPQIRAAGVAVVSVGVGSNIDETFLRSIATQPDFYIPATFDMLPALAARVEEAACDAIIESSQPPLPPSPPPVDDSCQAAFDACAFTFEGVTAVPTYIVSGQPDVPFTPRIIRKGGSPAVGVVNSQAGVFEPVFADTGTPISAEGNQNFTPTAFKTVVRNDTGSSIGHETFQGNQLIVADGRCVIVYFQSWQLLNATGGVVIGNINLAARDDSACVAFSTVA